MQVHRRVFDAFAALMAEHSYEAISMAQIAARAGLGRTAIYHHFPDKESVVVAFATSETERYLADLHGHLAATDDPVERLRTYLRHQLDPGQRFHMGLGPQLYGLLREDSLLQIREHVLAVEQVLADVLSGGRDAGALRFDDVRAAMSLVHACLTARGVPPDAVEEFVVRALSAERYGEVRQA